jgi:histidyl-tRNA synthetase
LRILDTKNPDLQDIVEQAPKLMAYLGEQSLKHYEGVQALLKNAGIHARLNPRLVRGLDYYHHTVFEWVTDQLGAQGTVCAGGRYDGLVAQLGGKPAPACGFAMGIERLLALWVDQGYQRERLAPDVYLVHQGDAAQIAAFKVAEQLRDAAFNVQLHCGGGSFKSQMKRADASGAPLAIVIGDDEAAAGEVSVKLLRESGEQRRISAEDAATVVGELILGTDASVNQTTEH